MDKLFEQYADRFREPINCCWVFDLDAMFELIEEEPIAILSVIEVLGDDAEAFLNGYKVALKQGVEGNWELHDEHFVATWQKITQSEWVCDECATNVHEGLTEINPDLFNTVGYHENTFCTCDLCGEKRGAGAYRTWIYDETELKPSELFRSVDIFAFDNISMSHAINLLNGKYQQVEPGVWSVGENTKVVIDTESKTITSSDVMVTLFTKITG